jgi:hypothetical protein
VSEVICYLALLNTLITVHQVVSVTAGSQVISLLCRGLVTFQDGRHKRERDYSLYLSSIFHTQVRKENEWCEEK